MIEIKLKDLIALKQCVKKKDYILNTSLIKHICNLIEDVIE